MNRFRVWRWGVVGAVLAASAVQAGPPSLGKLNPFKGVEADPAKDYPISERNGPWMIMTTTFSGEGGEEQALKLVHELRKKEGLAAYTYKKKFDFSKPVEGRGVDRYGDPLQLRYQQDEITEIAVLVGDYERVDDPEAQKALKRLKYLQPKSLQAPEGKATSQTFAELRSLQRAIAPEESELKKKGPLGRAFVTTNPLLPNEYFVPSGFDKLTLEMNKGVKYSLLDCPKRYTVKVATFSGQTILDQKKIAEIEQGRTFKSRLAQAAEKAHRLAEALRKKGYEAYEFHDRYSSIVTVGSFDAVGTPRSDGKTEINPKIHAIMRTFGGEFAPRAEKGNPVSGKPKSLLGIPFDLQPVPVEIPRRSLAADYSASAR